MTNPVISWSLNMLLRKSMMQLPEHQSSVSKAQGDEVTVGSHRVVSPPQQQAILGSCLKPHEHIWPWSWHPVRNTDNHSLSSSLYASPFLNNSSWVGLFLSLSVQTAQPSWSAQPRHPKRNQHQDSFLALKVHSGCRGEGMPTGQH